MTDEQLLKICRDQTNLHAVDKFGDTFLRIAKAVHLATLEEAMQPQAAQQEPAFDIDDFRSQLRQALKENGFSDYHLGLVDTACLVLLSKDAAPNEVAPAPEAIHHLWACNQETGKESYIRSGLFEDLKAEADRMNALGHDFFIDIDRDAAAKQADKDKP